MHRPQRTSTALSSMLQGRTPFDRGWSSDHQCCTSLMSAGRIFSNHQHNATVTPLPTRMCKHAWPALTGLLPGRLSHCHLAITTSSQSVPMLKSSAGRPQPLVMSSCGHLDAKRRPARLSGTLTGVAQAAPGRCRSPCACGGRRGGRPRGWATGAR